MNANITKNKRKLLVLASVIVLCAACLVTVAYAYDAVYNDNIAQKEISASETSKHIYIDGDLSYPQSITASVDVTYKSVTDVSADGTTTKLTAQQYEIKSFSGPSGFEGKASLTDDGCLLIDLGTVTVHRNNLTDADLPNGVFIYVTDLADTGLTGGDGLKSVLTGGDGLKSVLTNGEVQKSDILFTVGDSGYTHSVSFTNRDTVDVNVWVKAKVITVYSADSNDNPFRNENASSDGSITISSDTVDESGNVTNLKTVLAVPGFTVTVDALDSNSISVMDKLTANDIKVAKAMATADSSTTVTVTSSSNGASIVLNAAAILELSENDADFSATADTTDANKFTISLGNNTFGDTDSRLTITVPYNGSGDAAVYYNGDSAVSFTDATVSNGTVTFVTNHLSEYRIMSKNSADLTSAATIALGDDLTITYTSVQNAVKYVNDGETVTVLSGTHDMGTDFVFNTLSVPNTNVLTMVGTEGAVLKWTSYNGSNLEDANNSLSKVSLKDLTLITNERKWVNSSRGWVVNDDAYREYFNTTEVYMDGCEIDSLYTNYSPIATFVNCGFNDTRELDAYSDNKSKSDSAGKNFWSPIYSSEATVTFKNCTFNSREYALNVYNNNITGTVNLTVDSCTFNCTSTSDTDDIRSAIRVKTDASSSDAVLNLIVNKCIINGHKDSETGTKVLYTYDAQQGLLTIKQGDNANLDVKVIVDGVMVYDKGQNISIFPVYDSEDLQTVASLVNAGTKNYSGVTVKLMNDIDLKGVEWTPIGYSAADFDYNHTFQGTFDGNSKIISNLSINNTADKKSVGFFGTLNGAVKDITFSKANVKATLSNGSCDGIAIVAGSTYYSGTISNVTVIDSKLQGNATLGSLVGYASNSVTGCTIRNTLVNVVGSSSEGISGVQAGVVFGHLNGAKISNCTVEGCSITGYNFVGLFGGTGAYSNNFVSNTISGTNTVTVDRTITDASENIWSSWEISEGIYANKFIGCSFNTTPNDSNVLSDGAIVNITALVSDDNSFLKATQQDLSVIHIVLKGDVTYTVSKDYAIGTDKTEQVNINGENGDNGYTLTVNGMGSEHNTWWYYTTNSSAVMNLTNLQLDTTTTRGTWDNYDIRFHTPVSLTNVVSKVPIALDSDSILDNVTVTDKADGNYLVWIVATSSKVSISNSTIGDQVHTYNAIGIKDQYVSESDLKSTVLTVTNTKFVNCTEKAAVLVSSVFGATINWGTGNDISGTADCVHAVWSDDSSLASPRNNSNKYPAYANKTYADYANLIYVNGSTVVSRGSFFSVTENDTVTQYQRLVDAVSAAENNVSAVVSADVYSLTSLNSALSTLTSKAVTSTINIQTDLNLSDSETWSAVEGKSVACNLTINGNNHTITGLTEALLALVNYNNVVTVKNLTLSDSSINAPTHAGLSAAGTFVDVQYGNVMLIGCKVRNASVTSDAFAGGLVGYGPPNSSLSLTITNCTVESSKLNGTTVGGIVAILGDPLAFITGCTVKDCVISSTASLECDGNSTLGWQIGIIVGIVNGSGTKSISSCTTSGNSLTQSNVSPDSDFTESSYYWGEYWTSSTLTIDSSSVSSETVDGHSGHIHTLYPTNQ